MHAFTEGPQTLGEGVVGVVKFDLFDQCQNLYHLRFLANFKNATPRNVVFCDWFFHLIDTFRTEKI